MENLKGRRGFNAYQAELEIREKSSLAEPDALIDEFKEKAKTVHEPLQEKDTLKHLVGTDLRRQMPPQMYAVVSSLARMLEAVEGESK